MDKIGSVNSLCFHSEIERGENIFMNGGMVQTIIYALVFQHNEMIDDFNETMDEDEMDFLLAEITGIKETIKELEEKYGRKWI